jgi:hypothetical protein
LPRPHLADASREDAKPGGQSAPPAQRPGPGPGRERRGIAGPIAWILALLLVVCALMLARQTRTSARLQDRVESLQGELSRAQATLGAYEGHLDAVRSEVGEIARRMDALQELVDRDPRE